MNVDYEDQIESLSDRSEIKLKASSVSDKHVSVHLTTGSEENQSNQVCNP